MISVAKFRLSKLSVCAEQAQFSESALKNSKNSTSHCKIFTIIFLSVGNRRKSLRSERLKSKRRSLDDIYLTMENRVFGVLLLLIPKIVRVLHTHRASPIALSYHYISHTRRNHETKKKQARGLSINSFICSLYLKKIMRLQRLKRLLLSIIKKK
jgi:hypothetical protein